MDKFCKKCGLCKAPEDFSTVKRTYKGKTYSYLQSACKACMRAHSKFYDDNIRTTPKRNRTDDWRPMKSPVPWEALKSHTTLNPSKVYPLCEEGHRYVGETCLYCKVLEKRYALL